MNPLTCQVDIHWSDCDPFGIIYYPQYFRIMDTCYHQLLKAAGYDHHNIEEQAGMSGTPLVHAAVDCRTPTTFGDTLTITVAVTHWKTHSFSVNYRGSIGERLVFEGREDHVCVNKTANGIKGTPIPEKFRADVAAIATAAA